MAPIQTDAHRGLFPTLITRGVRVWRILPAGWVRLHDVE